MDEYPEELLTPPVPLVALVGMPEIHLQVSTFLSANQPSIVSISIFDPQEATILGGKEKRPVEARLPPPVGIIKSGWLKKHREKAAGAVALFLDRDMVYGDPGQWLAVCAEIDAIKASMKGRTMKLLVLLVHSGLGGEHMEDRVVAVRKRAEVEPKHCLSILLNHGTEHHNPFSKMGGVVVEMLSAHYREEGRRVKARIDRRNYSNWELTVRYYFKVAVYSEFRRDWVGALKNYESAYMALQEALVSSTLLEVQPILNLVEVKAVAELLHLKLATLLLHSGKEGEAVAWMRQHVAFFRNKVGPPEGAFLHWAWLARQFQVFGEMLQQRLGSGIAPASGTGGGEGAVSSGGADSVSERELLPAYYFQLAAKYMTSKRRAFESAYATMEALGEADGEDPLAGPADQVAPPLFIGQAPRLLCRGHSVHDQWPTEAEYLRHALLEQKAAPPSHAVIRLLERAHALYKDSHATRQTFQLASQIGREYFHVRDYDSARRFFGSVAVLYRLEGWAALLAATLGYLRECTRQLGRVEEYLQHSLELAALPIPGDGSRAAMGPISGPEVGPAGPLGEEQHAVVHEEVMGLLGGGLTTLPAVEGQAGMRVDGDHPVALVAEAGSPLKMGLAATAAFHEKSAKPGRAVTITVAMLSHLPRPVKLQTLQVAFSDRACDVLFTHREEGEGEGEGEGEVRGADLTLHPRQWNRVTFEVMPAVSGQLDCLRLIARFGPHATLSSTVEPPPASDLIPVWVYERSTPAQPFRDVQLAVGGQKWVEVEREEALVQLSLHSAEEALVGEALPVRVSAHSTGHVVRGGRLRIRVIATEASNAMPLVAPAADVGEGAVPPGTPPKVIRLDGGSGPLTPVAVSQVTSGMATPVDGPTPSPAELVAGDGAGEYEESSGLCDVPEIGVGGGWSTTVYVRWREVGAARVVATLTYGGGEEGERGEGGEGGFLVTQMRTLTCQDPLVTSHRYMGPIRRDALLPGGAGEPSAASLPLHDSCTMVLSVRNASAVPLKLMAFQVEEEDPAACRVVPCGASASESGLRERVGMDGGGGAGEGEEEGVVLGKEEAFTRLFRVTPAVTSAALHIGTVVLHWQRTERGREGATSEDVNKSGAVARGEEDLPLPDPVTRRRALPPVSVSDAPLVVTTGFPNYGLLGKPFMLTMKVENRTHLLQEIQFAVVDAQSFVFSGAHTGQVSVLPMSTMTLTFRLVAIASGMLQLPQVKVTAVRYSATLQPSAASTHIFVYPSKPRLPDASSELVMGKKVETSTDQ